MYLMLTFKKVPVEEFKKALNKEFGDKFETIECDLHSNIILPTRASIGSCGYDIVTPFEFEIAPTESIIIPTGISFVTDEYDKALMVYPRSGLGFKHRCRLANTVGVVDADYHYSDNYGHIMLKITNEGNTIMKIEAGKAIAQGVIIQYYTVDYDDVNSSRNGGFGSSGR